jgi:hypothetical protein
MQPERNSAAADRREPVAFERTATQPQTWWLRAPELAEQARRLRPRVRSGGSYRLGDAILVLDSDDGSVADGIRELFAECAVDDSEGAGTASRVKCSLRSLRDHGLISLELEATAPLDAVEIVRSLLEPRLHTRCFERPSGREGWRLVGRTDSDEPLAAISQDRVLLRAPELPPHFLRNLVSAAALRIQSGVLFLHGASACVNGAALLLAGRAGAGKTTLALTLASRGHGLLGDDLAALRIASLELLPMRRVLHIRRGLRAALVEEALRDRRIEMETLPDASQRAVVEARDLFPLAGVSAGALRAAFFLRAFRKRPARERFVPSLDRVEQLRHLPERLQWGITPSRRLLRFAQTVGCLGRIPCFFLDVGRPEETADLIEETVEEL